jgi:hypothetical protein
MLEKCGTDFNFFYLASTNLEVWGSQFKSLSHIRSTSNTDYKSLSPVLRRECKKKNLVTFSGEKFAFDNINGRFRIIMGEWRGMFE